MSDREQTPEESGAQAHRPGEAYSQEPGQAPGQGPAPAPVAGHHVQGQVPGYSLGHAPQRPQSQVPQYPQGQYPQGQAPQYPQGQSPGYPAQGQAPQVPRYPQGQAPQYPPPGQVPQYPAQRQAPQYPAQGQAPQYPAQSQAPQYQQGQAPQYPQGHAPQYPPPGQYPGAQQPGAPYGAVASPPRRRVWPWLVGAGAVVIVALVAVLTIPPLLAAPAGPVAATPDVTILPIDPSPAESDSGTDGVTTAPQPTPTEEEDLSAVFAERDAFFAAQQQPMDGSELTPKTPEQQQFIADQTAWVEQNGGTVTSQAVSIWLALAIDGCETAILNAHDVDSSIFAMHVSTSPLISALVAQSDNPDAEPNLAQTMVFGMGYICPSDGAQWSPLWDEAYGG